MIKPDEELIFNPAGEAEYVPALDDTREGEAEVTVEQNGDPGYEIVAVLELETVRIADELEKQGHEPIE